MDDPYTGRPGRYSLDSGERIPVNPPPESEPETTAEDPPAYEPPSTEEEPPQ